MSNFSPPQLECVLRSLGRLKRRTGFWSENAEKINMPLAYLADPWQKMKVHEEIEVILRPDNLAVKVSNFQFRMIMKGSKLIRINLIFPLS